MHVDGAKGLFEGEHAEDDHQHRAHERARGPVDLQAGDLAQADEQVGDYENDECRDHGSQLTFDTVLFVEKFGSFALSLK